MTPAILPPEVLEALAKLGAGLRPLALLDLRGGLLFSNSAWAELGAAGTDPSFQEALAKVGEGLSASVSLPPGEGGGGRWRITLSPFPIGGQGLGALAQAEKAPEAPGDDLLSSVFRLMPVALGVNRLSDGVFLEVNEAFLRMFGASPEDLVGRTPADFGLWSRPGDQDRVLGELLSKGEIRNLELEVHRKDGSGIPVLYSGRKVWLKGKTHVLSLVHDWGSPDEAQRARRESQELFTRMFELNPEGMALSRVSDGSHLAVNAAFEETHGWRREEVVGRTAKELGLWADPHQGDLFAELLLRKGVLSGVEAQHLRKDGTPLTALVSACVLDVQGEACILSIGRDVTAHRREEEILRRAQKLESLGVLAGGIAHDFNNLFQALLANLDLAQAEEARPAVASRLEAMGRILQRAQALSRQMLIYAGQGSLAKEIFDLTQLIGEIPELLKVSVPKKATLEVDLAQEPAMVVGDPSQIQQVVLNLVVNAAEALFDGEGRIHLRSRLERIEGPFPPGAYLLEPALPGPHMVLEVEDNGRGMDPGTLGKIFDPFFSTKAPGRGLGLSSMLGILRAHRAGIQVWTNPGAGSRFQVAFPLADVRAAPRADLPAAPLPRMGEARGRILYADDEVEVREATTALLETLGYTVDQAVDGLEAVQCFCRNPAAYDLVLLDATMPRMSGPEALEGMLSLRPGLRAVLCTGYSAEAQKEARLAEGFVRVLQKPFTLRELQMALAAARSLNGAS